MLIFDIERRHKWFNLLNVSQLDEQTNPNSWRKVHFKVGNKRQKIDTFLLKYWNILKLQKAHEQMQILK